MSRLKWTNSIRFRIPALIVLIIIIPFLLIWWFNYSSLTSTMIEYSGKVIQSRLKNMALSVEGITANIERFASGCIDNNDFKNEIYKYTQLNNKVERNLCRSKITLYLTQKKLENPYISTIYVIIDGSPTLITIDLGNKELSIESGEGKLIYEKCQKEVAGNKCWLLYNDYFSCDGGERLAYADSMIVSGICCSVIFVTQQNSFSRIFEDIDTDSGYAIACDFMGKTLLRSKNTDEGFDAANSPALECTFALAAFSDSYVAEIDGRPHLVVYYRSELSFWRYYQMIPLNEVLGSNSEQVSMTVLMLTAGVLVAAIGAVIMSKYVVNPLSGLVGGMKNIEQGHFLKIREKNVKDEIWLLQSGFNHMAGKLNSLINEVYLQQILRQEAQLKNMQSQIDEHFLYNTLNSIMCKASEEGALKTEEMLKMLSRYFRMNLSEGKSFVSIEEIVLLLKCYLSLQKIRFGKRLDVSIKVDESLKGKYVLKYLFQPIVENAVVHGVEGFADNVSIMIAFENRDGKLYFWVKNSGRVIEEKELLRLRKSIEVKNKVEGESFALKNLNAQIAMTYGKEYGISIFSSENEGTIVNFTIPLRDAEVIKNDRVFSHNRR
jgi:sensor histidine kinase YesM